MRISVPPGRAGRLWLRRRLATAARGLVLLDRRLRLLGAERDRLAELAARTGERWTAALAEAEIWTSRVAALGGERALRSGTPAGRVRVEVTGDHRDVVCHFPPDPEHLPLTSALLPARAACQAG
ncbi:hypothetical protein, partial [Sphaerisporangium rubeum]|uniref:hypothetical protein n=1 Tax=Sphaerisporangium rubeum TaxID=321317 RepID=UPI0031D7FED0